ncbi:hypothetical protein O9G_003746 [Rozella allomycis CSF55]|uniref:Uncharacterized protein n=1 Tax=Rozella allomycis (strain CSF55) TaxID=988480 RepID=A0A075AZP3_ROZAC|nr:hypothetical protein O9G_003746 [Rozella allomycis CSF55]|eukprot:EPZ34147.1 hypothetical protein O9G_003746 [Rozella allomycis CSF55]
MVNQGNVLTESIALSDIAENDNLNLKSLSYDSAVHTHTAGSPLVNPITVSKVIESNIEGNEEASLTENLEGSECQNESTSEHTKETEKEHEERVEEEIENEKEQNVEIKSDEKPDESDSVVDSVDEDGTIIASDYAKETINQAEIVDEEEKEEVKEEETQEDETIKEEVKQESIKEDKIVKEDQQSESCDEKGFIERVQEIPLVELSLNSWKHFASKYEMLTKLQDLAIESTNKVSQIPIVSENAQKLNKLGGEGLKKLEETFPIIKKSQNDFKEISKSVLAPINVYVTELLPKIKENQYSTKLIETWNEIMTSTYSEKLYESFNQVVEKLKVHYAKMNESEAVKKALETISYLFQKIQKIAKDFQKEEKTKNE